MNNNAFPAILSLDIGTSSTRAILYHAETGKIVEETMSSCPHEPDASGDGGSTLDPAQLLAEVMQCMEHALSTAPQAEIRAVACSTFWHSTIGVDAEGEPVTPVLLWSD